MTLSTKKQISVRFNEVDALGIVWHGAYATYFEDAREAFGKAFGLDYLSIYAQGYYVPLVNLNFSYKKPLRYGDKAWVEITYIPVEANKIVFEYRILNELETEVMATGRSEQVFLNRDSMELLLYPVAFYAQWKEKYLK